MKNALRIWLLLAAIAGLTLPQAASAQEPPAGFPFSFLFPFPAPAPQPEPVPPVTLEPEPVTEAAPPPAEPVRPRIDAALKPITLGGWMSILELTPTLGDEIAANGRLWIVFEHQISGIPEGWRLGYRIYGAYTAKNGRTCDDCYLAEGLFGNNRGYISGKVTVTWTSFTDSEARYRDIQICVTAIDPVTNEIRLSNLCESRRAG